MLFNCCWSRVCCWMRGNVVVGNCVNFWVRVFVFFKWKFDGNFDGRVEENEGGVVEVRLGVVMENIGVDREWLLLGVCRGIELREIIGVDRGWLLWDVVIVILWRLGCWKDN